MASLPKRLRRLQVRLRSLRHPRHVRSPPLCGCAFSHLTAMLSRSRKHRKPYFDQIICDKVDNATGVPVYPEDNATFAFISVLALLLPSVFAQDVNLSDRCHRYTVNGVNYFVPCYDGTCSLFNHRCSLCLSLSVSLFIYISLLVSIRLRSERDNRMRMAARHLP